MSKVKQLPHLIKLLDDDSDIVRENVMTELASFGPGLEEELKHQNIVLNPAQQGLLNNLLGEYARTRMREEWKQWLTIRDDKLKLETALGFIARFLHGNDSRINLHSKLDTLCDEYNAAYGKRDIQLLAHFLFTAKKIAGASESDYYNPMNSSLVHLIDAKRGIPISLVCLYILVGHRLGLNIEGCNFPGHFLALAFTQHEKYIVDCFNGGKILSEKDFSALTKSPSIEIKDVFQLECDAATIMTRVLRNLMNSYQKLHDQSNVKFMEELIGTIEAEDTTDEEDENQ